MSLKHQLQTELNQALKDGAPLKRSVLGMVITALKNRELAKRSQLSQTISATAELEEKSQLTDEEVMAVIAGEVKKRKEALEQFTSGGRRDLAEKEQAELMILEKYLPAQLSEAAIRPIVKTVITETGAKTVKDIGKVIGAVLARLPGQTDGATVGRIVKQELAN